MTATSEKVKLLKEHGYWYNFTREIYVNSRVKKVFALEAIEDHNVEWLRDRLSEENTSGDWRFYFDGDPPSPPVRDKIISELV